jgi:hypothetical protein
LWWVEQSQVHILGTALGGVGQGEELIEQGVDVLTQLARIGLGAQGLKTLTLALIEFAGGAQAVKGVY